MELNISLKINNLDHGLQVLLAIRAAAHANKSEVATFNCFDSYPQTVGGECPGAVDLYLASKSDAMRAAENARDAPTTASERSAAATEAASKGNEIAHAAACANLGPVESCGCLTATSASAL